MLCISTARSSINFITWTLDNTYIHRSASQRGNVVQELQFSVTSDRRYGAVHKNTCYFSIFSIVGTKIALVPHTLLIHSPLCLTVMYIAQGPYQIFTILSVSIMWLMFCCCGVICSTTPQPPAAQCHVLAELLLIWTSSIL